MRLSLCKRAICLLAIGCFIQIATADRFSVQADPLPKRVSLVRVLANPGNFDGVHLRTYGYAVFEFEDSSLYLTQLDARHHVYANSIWLRVEAGDVDVAPFSGKYVMVEGTFDSGDHGHADLSSGSLRLSRIEALSQ